MPKLGQTTSASLRWWLQPKLKTAFAIDCAGQPSHLGFRLRECQNFPALEALKVVYRDRCLFSSLSDCYVLFGRRDRQRRDCLIFWRARHKALISRLCILYHQHVACRVQNCILVERMQPIAYLGSTAKNVPASTSMAFSCVLFGLRSGKKIGACQAISWK